MTLTKHIRPIKHLTWLFVLLFPIASTGQQQFSEIDLNPESRANLEQKFNLEETLIYKQEKEGSIFLENGYASAVLKNPEDWLKIKDKYEVLEIHLIYTKYPLDKSLWRTNYKKLLSNRLAALFAIDSNLNSMEIEWSIVLQTNCKNEEEAKQLPHGIQLLIEPKTSINNQPEENLEGQLKEVGRGQVVGIKDQLRFKKFLLQLSPSPDSTIEHIFNRHPEWKNSLVVMDWTGSMYEFGAKLMLWHAEHQSSSGVKNVVLFTDQRSHTNSKSIGECGGVFYIENSNLEKVLKLMKSLKNQESNDVEENNIDAILKGVERTKDFDELIMIADNRSCMKDYCKADEIKLPIKIILCGSQLGINPQYVNLAYLTKGSIHTEESDTWDIQAYAQEGKVLIIDGFKFVFNSKKKRFEAKFPHSRNAFQDCRPFYKKKCGECDIN